MDMPPRSLEDYLDEAARAQLRSFPNVTDIGIGLRMKNGAFTSEWGVVVYVKEKLSESQLPKEAVLPKEIAGLPLDVQEELDTAYIKLSDGELLDLTKIRPIRSGIAISTSAASDGAGTLGCFAKRNSDNKEVLISNYHVLFRNKGLPGINEGDSQVYQPLAGSDNEIGVVPDGTGTIGGQVDCALAVLAEEGSCCCCKHVIPHENKVGTTQLVGVGTAQIDIKVFKTGAKSGPTVGKIVNASKTVDGKIDYSKFFLPAGDSFAFSNIIIVVFFDEAADDFDPTKPFAEPGDSGSVIYNEAHEIVGLHFASYDDPKTGNHYSLACHIHLVETALGVTIPGTRNIVPVVNTPPTGEVAVLDTPIDGNDVSLASSEMTEQTHLERWWQKIYPQLVAAPELQPLLSLAETHIYEIMHLVNQRREVTVTWHRNHGPTYIAAIGRSVKVPTYQIPQAIEGVSRQQLLTTMAAVLTKHGSPQLQAAIEKCLPLLARLIDQFNSADAVAEAIQNRQWLEVLDNFEIEV
ncbi:MAG: hypothetical protein GC179_15910 [Anaerolineaceae bacterium]|nr:hypothetical protein [Anaerolineaceae bacterium]